MRAFAASVRPCCPPSKPAPGNVATRNARLRAPKPPGAFIVPEAMWTPAPAAPNSESQAGIGCRRTFDSPAGPSSAEHRLDAEPYRTDESGDDDGDHGLERIALGLLDAPAPPPQMLEIGPQFSAIALLYSERGQDRHHRLEHHRLDIVRMTPLLLGQRFGDHRADIVALHHRLMIRATFSNPRFAK